MRQDWGCCCVCATRCLETWADHDKAYNRIILIRNCDFYSSLIWSRSATEVASLSGNKICASHEVLAVEESVRWIVGREDCLSSRLFAHINLKQHGSVACWNSESSDEAASWLANYLSFAWKQIGNFDCWRTRLKTVCCIQLKKPPVGGAVAYGDDQVECTGVVDQTLNLGSNWVIWIFNAPQPLACSCVNGAHKWKFRVWCRNWGGKVRGVAQMPANIDGAGCWFNCSDHAWLGLGS